MEERVIAIRSMPTNDNYRKNWDRMHERKIKRKERRMQRNIVKSSNIREGVDS